jgi:hypothetical protein
MMGVFQLSRAGNARRGAIPLAATTVCLAVTAIAASSAAAGEYGRCRDIGKKGEYSDPNCQIVAIKKGKPKGAYEWEPGAPKECVAQRKGKYSDSGCTVEDIKNGKAKGSFEKEPGPGFTATMGAVKSGPLGCANAHAVGSITGTSSGTIQITLNGCTATVDGLTGICTTSGEPAGTVETAVMATLLVRTHSHVVLTRYASMDSPAGNLAEGDCGSSLPFSEEVSFALSGEGEAVTAGDVNVQDTTNEVDFGPGTSSQDFTLTSSLGTFSGELSCDVIVTFESPVEIRES